MKTRYRLGRFYICNYENNLLETITIKSKYCFGITGLLAFLNNRLHGCLPRYSIGYSVADFTTIEFYLNEYNKFYDFHCVLNSFMDFEFYSDNSYESQEEEFKDALYSIIHPIHSVMHPIPQRFYSVPVIGPNKNNMEIKSIGIDDMYPSLYERGIYMNNLNREQPIDWAHPMKIKNSLSPKKIIYSGNKTIVIWEDDVKTIVSLAEGDQYDPYLAFCAALAKRVYGSTSAAKRIIDKKTSINKKTKPVVKLNFDDDIFKNSSDAKQAFDELSKKVRDVIGALNKNWRVNEDE